MAQFKRIMEDFLVIAPFSHVVVRI